MVVGSVVDGGEGIEGGSWEGRRGLQGVLWLMKPMIHWRGA